MGLIDDVKHGIATRWGYQKAGQRETGVQVVFAGEAPATQYDWGGLTDTQRERLAVTCAWVYSDVEELGRLASSSVLDVYRWEGEETVAQYDHELERVLRTPNPHMGRGFVTKLTIWWLLLSGEAYWMLAENNAGELAGYYPLPASRVVPIKDPVKYISGYKYYPVEGRPPKTLSLEQVFFVRFPNIFDYHRGLSPLSAYQRVLKTDIKAEEWNFNTFVNEATLRTMFVVNQQGGMFEKTKAEMIEQLVDKQKRFMIVPGDEVKPHNLGIPPKDMEFLAGREFNRDQIDRVYGFQEGYWSEKGQRANREAAKASVIEGPVWSLLTLLAESLTAQVVVPRYGSEYVVKPSDIRPRDRHQDMLERRIYWPVVKLNEARAELGKEDYDGPLADEIAELPVSLATNPQFVMALIGLASPMGGAVKTGGNGQQAREDLRRWRSIERRRFKEGEQPGSYEFVTDWLPDNVIAEIKAALARADSEDAINQAFDVDLGALPIAPPAAGVDRERIELAIQAGVPLPRLWPKLGLEFTDEQLAAMEVEFGRLDKPLWEPERELEVNDD